MRFVGRLRWKEFNIVKTLVISSSIKVLKVGIAREVLKIFFRTL